MLPAAWLFVIAAFVLLLMIKVTRPDAGSGRLVWRKWPVRLALNLAGVGAVFLGTGAMGFQIGRRPRSADGTLLVQPIIWSQIGIGCFLLFAAAIVWLWARSRRDE